MKISLVPRRLKIWLAASIGNRITALLLLFCVSFLIVAGAGNLVYLVELTHHISEDALNESARDVANELQGQLLAIEDDGVQLAKNPTVLSALLDAGNPESYLQPLLSSFTPRNRTPENLCIVDYKGETIGCADRRGHNTKQKTVRSVVESGTLQARMLGLDTGQHILSLVYPLVYEGTGSAEGALVAEYDLKQLFLQVLGTSSQFHHIHLRSTQYGDIHRIDSVKTSIHSARSLALDEPYGELGLVVSLGVAEEVFNAPLMRLLAVYGGVALLLLAAVYFLTIRAVPPLVARLVAMADAARKIAEDQSLSFRLEQVESDEIGQLALAFSTLTQRLQAANQSLEATVIQRTHELQEKEALLHGIVDAVPGAIFQCRRNADGRVYLPFASSGLSSIFGVNPTDVREDWSPALEWIHLEDRQAIVHGMNQSAAMLVPLSLDFRICPGNRPARWIHVDAMPQSSSDDLITWHGIFTDVTSHKAAELALADSEAYSRALFQYSYLPQVVIDGRTGCYIDCNDAAVDIYRMGRREQVLGKSPIDVSAPTQYDGTPSPEAVRGHIEQARRDGFHIFEWRHQRPDGEFWDAEVRLMALRHRGKELFQFTLRDITDQKRSEAEIWRRANFDGLTGLANRSLCLDRLARAMAQAKRFGTKVGILFVDLDGFKGINDSLGHAAGDELLTEVARRLEGCIREQDTVARFGGDEFVLVIQDLAEREDICRVADEVLAALFQPFTIAGNVRQISGSLGIAIFPDDSEEIEHLLALADQALYCSKNAGKNRYEFASLKGAGRSP